MVALTLVAPCTCDNTQSHFPTIWARHHYPSVTKYPWRPCYNPQADAFQSATDSNSNGNDGRTDSSTSRRSGQLDSISA